MQSMHFIVCTNDILFGVWFCIWLTECQISMQCIRLEFCVILTIIRNDVSLTCELAGSGMLGRRPVPYPCWYTS